jgi:hypothetical protein
MLLFGASAASAATDLMPPRDFLMGVSEVVWGVTTQANGTPFVIDFGDGTQASGNVVDRSYISFNHSYVAGPFTVQLCVGAGAAIPGCPGELTNVLVKVFNPALLSPAELRGLNINRTIQDGLRYLWFNQTSRAANFPTAAPTNANLLTNWSSASWDTALVVLAFENQGYHVPADDSAPTGLYEKYVVQRGLSYIMNNLVQVTLSAQHAGADDPCVGVPAPVCTGLNNNETEGYGNAIASLPFSASSALGRHALAGLGGATFSGTNAGFVGGRTYGEILQRIMNTQTWGQNDGAQAGGIGACVGRGGWIYSYSNNACQQSDGSTVGWNMLSILDAIAAGINVPAFVQTEFNTFALPQGLNTDGTYDYRADNNPATAGGVGNNLARAAIGLQGLFYVGAPVADPRVVAGLGAINGRWLVSPGTDYLNTCGNVNFNNKGCAYSMFNVFKALRLYGVHSLPAAADWYGEYQDWLVGNQSSPTTASGGGGWVGGTGGRGPAPVAVTSMVFSCCGGDQFGNAAIAELILAPVALIPPDPTLFGTVGLSQGNPPSQADDTNPINTDHTVTALVQSANLTPIAGATVGFTIVSGPNTGASGTCVPAGCVTGADGKVAFTYHSGGGTGTDVIRANIGNLLSNTLNKIWIIPTNKCDANSDGKVDYTDLGIIRAAFGQTPSGANDPRDGNSDGAINVLDLRYCQLRLTPPAP